MPEAEHRDPFSGHSIDIVVTPTISAAAIYAAGDALGGLMTFTEAVRMTASAGKITKVVIIDDDQEQAAIDIVFFNQTFTPTADNAPFSPSDADMQNCIGHVNVLAAEYSNFATNSVATKLAWNSIGFCFQVVGTSLFAQMVVRATPTYTAIDDLTIKITVEQD